MSSHSFVHKLNEYTSRLASYGLLRRRRIVDGSLLNFSCNDYLSLSSDIRLKRAYEAGFKRYPVGSGGSMVVSGFHPLHQTLETTLAEAFNVDSCLLFVSGYAANLGVASMLGALKAPVMIDKLVHASIYDGLNLSQVPFQRFIHNNMKDLAVKLDGVNESAVTITEGIFSMGGQHSPLGKISKLCTKQSHAMIVDETHSFGVVGDQGLGAVNEHQLSQAEVPIRVLSFGKSCAASGAIVAGDGAWTDTLLQCARSYMYSTGISPAFAYGLLKTIEVVRAADDRRQKLNDLIHYFREKIFKSPLKWQNSYSPIQHLLLGCPKKAMNYAAHLEKNGILCLPMRQPTVKKSETGLRVILNYEHQPEQIDSLFTFLHSYEY